MACLAPSTVRHALLCACTPAVVGVGMQHGFALCAACCHHARGKGNGCQGATRARGCPTCTPAPRWALRCVWLRHAHPRCSQGLRVRCTEVHRAPCCTPHTPWGCPVASYACHTLCMFHTVLCRWQAAHGSRTPCTPPALPYGMRYRVCLAYLARCAMVYANGATFQAMAYGKGNPLRRWWHSGVGCRAIGYHGID